MEDRELHSMDMESTIFYFIEFGEEYWFSSLFEMLHLDWIEGDCIIRKAMSLGYLAYVNYLLTVTEKGEEFYNSREEELDDFIDRLPEGY
jgi:hypothetical protein